MVASTLALGGGLALAQDTTPVASPVAGGALEQLPISNPDGKIVAYAGVTEGDEGVTFVIESVGTGILEPGQHGIHIHEVGSCDASGEKPYDSAGGHFNPEGHTHGDPDEDDAHAGDLGNIEVAEDGTFSLEITTAKVTLERGQPSSLDDADGSALVIHAGEDDLETDPSGDSGDRVACGIIFPSVEPAPNATPPTSATPAATPAS